MSAGAAHRLLTAEEELELAWRIQAGDDEAFETLVRHNYRLVWAYAQRAPVTPSFSYEDAFQAGIFGLLTAARRFRAEKGCRFSTFAVWWIRQAIQRAVDNESTVIRLPSHVAERLRAIRRQAAVSYPGEDLPPESALVTLAELSQQVMSLSQPIAEDMELADMLADDTDFTADVEEGSEQEYRRYVLKRALMLLPPREREVIELRFGLGGREHTLQEVGDYFGVSRERIRQLERKALDRLRIALEPLETELAA